jgi:hypothetical protein
MTEDAGNQLGRCEKTFTANAVNGVAQDALESVESLAPSVKFPVLNF